MRPQDLPPIQDRKLKVPLAANATAGGSKLTRTASGQDWQDRDAGVQLPSRRGIVLHLELPLTSERERADEARRRRRASNATLKRPVAGLMISRPKRSTWESRNPHAPGRRRRGTASDGDEDVVPPWESGCWGRRESAGERANGLPKNSDATMP